jgi:hypothetical protein
MRKERYRQERVQESTHGPIVPFATLGQVGIAMIEDAVDKCDRLSCRDADVDRLTHVTPIYPSEVI